MYKSFKAHLSQQISQDKIVDSSENQPQIKKQHSFLMSLDEDTFAPKQEQVNLMQEVEQFERQYLKSSRRLEESIEEKKQIPLRSIGYLIGSVLLTSLRGPLFLMIQSHPLFRAAWRLIFIGLIYMVLAIKNELLSMEFFTHLKHVQKYFVLVCISQAVFMGSLSVSVEYGCISTPILLFNSSTLIYCFLKMAWRAEMSNIEYLGLFIGVFGTLLMVVHDDVYSHDKTYLNLVALVGASASFFQQFNLQVFLLGHINLKSAQNLFPLQLNLPHFSLLASTRIAAGILTMIASLLFEELDSKDLKIFTTDELLYILLHVVLTGIIVNYSQNQILEFISPQSQRFISFTEAIPTTLFAYAFGQQKLPSLQTWFLMIVCILGLILMQIGRKQSETEEIQLNFDQGPQSQIQINLPSMYSVKFRKMDTLVEDNPLAETILNKRPSKEIRERKATFDLNIEN